MPTPPTATQDDAADTLAKELIVKFCNAANTFVQHRVMPEYSANPLEGLRLPFAPLAEQLRKFAGKTAAIANAPPIAPPPISKDWFKEGSDTAPESPAQAPAATAPAPQPPPAVIYQEVETEAGGESVSFDKIISTMSGRKMRLPHLAAELNLSTESLARFIASPNSGLAISGPGWVQVKA